MSPLHRESSFSTHLTVAFWKWFACYEATSRRPETLHSELFAVTDLSKRNSTDDSVVFRTSEDNVRVTREVVASSTNDPIVKHLAVRNVLDCEDAVALNLAFGDLDLVSRFLLCHLSL